MRAQISRDDEWIEIEALSLLDDDPEVRDTFLRLTDQGSMHLRTEPRPDRLTWDGRKIPSERDLSLDAVTRLLILLDYVAGVERLGSSDYVVRVSDKAKEVRSIYDRLSERPGDPSPETSHSTV